MNYGDRFKEIRLKLFMSQKEIAKELNVSFATVNRWENNQTKPSLKAQKAFNEFCKNNNIVF